MKKTTVSKILYFFIIIILFSLTVQAAGDVFSFYFILHKSDQVDVISFEAAPGRPTNFPEPIPGYPNKYVVELVSFFNETLYQAEFDIDFEMHPYPANPEELAEDVSVENITKEIRLSYFPEAEKLNLYHNGNLIYVLYIKDYLCNIDGTCSEYENYLNCPLDCHSGSKDSYCDGLEDGICDPDCAKGKDPDCELKKAETNASITGCGDSICDNTESYLNCPKDCPSGRRDGYCDGVRDGKCDPDCLKNEDPDCISGTTYQPGEGKAVQKANTTKIIIAAIFGVLIVFVIIFMIIRMKKEKPEAAFRQNQ